MLNMVRHKKLNFRSLVCFGCLTKAEAIAEERAKRMQPKRRRGLSGKQVAPNYPSNTSSDSDDDSSDNNDNSTSNRARTESAWDDGQSGNPFNLFNDG